MLTIDVVKELIGLGGILVVLVSIIVSLDRRYKFTASLYNKTSLGIFPKTIKDYSIDHSISNVEVIRREHFIKHNGMTLVITGFALKKLCDRLGKESAGDYVLFGYGFQIRSTETEGIPTVHIDRLDYDSMHMATQCYYIMRSEKRCLYLTLDNGIDDCELFKLTDQLSLT